MQEHRQRDRGRHGAQEQIAHGQVDDERVLGLPQDFGGEHAVDNEDVAADAERYHRRIKRDQQVKDRVGESPIAVLWVERR